MSRRQMSLRGWMSHLEAIPRPRFYASEGKNLRGAPGAQSGLWRRGCATSVRATKDLVVDLALRNQKRLPFYLAVVK